MQFEQKIESNTWEEIGFRLELTNDGSPSLRMIYNQETQATGECMHHSGGAASETQLIYAEPMKEWFQTHQNSHLVVVGLGLGYIEMFAAAVAIQQNNQILLSSFETVQPLKKWIQDWLQGHEINQQIKATYEECLRHVEMHTQVCAEKIREHLKTLIKEKRWTFYGALEEDFSKLQTVDVFLYDAFSAKTDPGLWEEKFLMELLAKKASANCVLTTYACRQSLKSALKNSGFEVQVREGFQGKRNSTLALRRSQI